MWKAATNGKVIDAVSAASFAKDLPSASVIAQGLVAGGMHPDQVLPIEVLTNPNANNLKRSLLAYASSRQGVVEQIVPGSGTSSNDGSAEAFMLVMGRQAVAAVGSIPRLRALQQVILTWKDADFDKFEAIMKAAR